MDPIERIIEHDGPLDVRRTLRRFSLWGGDPTMKTLGGHVHRAVRTLAGSATLRYAAEDGRVRVTGWGPGAALALDRAHAHLGLLDSGPFVTEHPLLAAAAKRRAGVRFGRTEAVVDRLVHAILGQKVTAKGASRSHRELVHRFGERAPGPFELWVSPAPEVLARVAMHDYHLAGIEQRRARTIVEVCKRPRRMEAVRDMDAEEGTRRLAALPGIGPWTIGHVRSVALGDEDAIPVGDYHLPNAVAFNLAGEARADDARMLELLEPFRPRRAIAIMLLMLEGEAAPRFGPRLPVRDIRGE